MRVPLSILVHRIPRSKNDQFYTFIVTHLPSVLVTYVDDSLMDLIGIDKAMLNGFFLFLLLVRHPMTSTFSEEERSIDILVVASIVMTDENAVLFVSCLLRKYIDVDTMSM